MTIHHEYPTLMVIDTRTQCFAFQVDNSGSGGRFGIGFTRSFLEVRNHALAAECLASCRSAADQLVASISRNTFPASATFELSPLRLSRTTPGSCLSFQLLTDPPVGHAI